MCGILGVYINKHSIKVVENLFDIFYAQKNRGTDGGGILIKNKSIFRFRSHNPFKIFSVKHLDIWDKLKDNSIVCFHHRYPTSTKNKPLCNHPIANEDKSIFLCHNGIISADKGILAGNHTFETQDGKDFTDSEIAVHMIEEHLSETKEKAIETMAGKIGYSFASSIVFKDEHKIFLVRKSCPLIIFKDKANNYYYASELDDKLGFEKVKELKDGEIGWIDAEGYHIIKEGETYQTYSYSGDWNYQATLTNAWNKYTKYEPKETIKNAFTNKQNKKIMQFFQNLELCDKEEALVRGYQYVVRNFGYHNLGYEELVAQLEIIYEDLL
jgi:glucosamine 6-phosphate synthetase-like amidotransferase/phosphosugar isomerase protein